MQVSLVLCSEGGQLLYAKGEVAEDSFLCPEKCFWGITEHVIHCHICVECYRRWIINDYKNAIDIRCSVPMAFIIIIYICAMRLFERKLRGKRNKRGGKICVFQRKT